MRTEIVRFDHLINSQYEWQYKNAPACGQEGTGYTQAQLDTKSLGAPGERYRQQLQAITCQDCKAIFQARHT